MTRTLFAAFALAIAGLAIFYPSHPKAGPVSSAQASSFDTSPPLASLHSEETATDAPECDEPNGCGVAPDPDEEQQRPNAPPPAPPVMTTPTGTGAVEQRSPGTHDPAKLI